MGKGNKKMRGYLVGQKADRTGNPRLGQEGDAGM